MTRKLFSTLLGSPRLLAMSAPQGAGVPKSLLAVRALAVMGAVLGAAPAAQASVVFYMSQVGANVVVTGSGSLLTGTGATQPGSSTFAGPNGGFMTVGVLGSPVNLYSVAFSGASNFGVGFVTFASSGTGDDFGLRFADGYIVAPTDYVSGSALSGTATYNNQTLAGMGFTAGKSYTTNYSFGSGPGNPVFRDSFTINIVATPAATVPEPASLGLAVAALGALALARHRTKA